MKVTYRIPTSEPYAYVEITDEFDEPRDDIEAGIAINYKKLTQAMSIQPTFGMPELEFSRYIDLVGNGKAIEGDPGILEKMSPKQQYAVNTLKKFIKRCAYQAKK